MDDLERTCFPDDGLLEGPDALTLGLCSISNYQHDQLAVLLRHNLGLLHEGGCLALGRRRSSRLGLDVEVELGLQLAVLVLHHALVVPAVIGTRLLNTQHAIIYHLSSRLDQTVPSLSQ